MYFQEKPALSDETNSLLPRQLPFLFDNDAAFAVIESLRWLQGKHCPRCKSVFTKSVNTAVFRELIRCIDCGYMFNKLSGTMFQGAKIPMYKFFQLFVLHDAIGRQISPRDVSYAVDVSHKTALALLGRLQETAEVGQFTSTDKALASTLRAAAGALPPVHGSANFFMYCDSKDITVNAKAFDAYVEMILRDK